VALDATIGLSMPTTTRAMAEPTDQLRNVLEKIRDHACEALTLLGHPQDQRSLAWQCTACGHVKCFTRPVPVEVTRPCPKCKGESFEAR
jgi:rubrerythrin